MSKTPRATLERFRLIDAIAQWEGVVSNARLRELTGLHSVQVSGLIAAYNRTFPRRLTHDRAGKCYRLRRGVTIGVSLDQYLHLLMVTQNGGSSPSPFVYDERIDLTEVKPEIYAALHGACANAETLEIEYHSMTHPKGLLRRIGPHSLVRIGRRWHVRAWCFLRERFADFNLGRITLAQRILEPNRRTAEFDDAWNSALELKLAAHRDLTAEHKRLVRNEMFAGDAIRVLSVRACLIPYVIQDLRAALDPLKQQPPDYQLEVANRAELRGRLFPSA
jgi:hypothetical protein